MEYEQTIKLLKENTEIRELLVNDHKQLAIDILSKQFDRLYHLIKIKDNLVD